MAIAVVDPQTSVAPATSPGNRRSSGSSWVTTSAPEEANQINGRTRERG